MRNSQYEGFIKDNQGYIEEKSWVAKVKHSGKNKLAYFTLFEMSSATSNASFALLHLFKVLLINILTWSMMKCGWA